MYEKQNNEKEKLNIFLMDETNKLNNNLLEQKIYANELKDQIKNLISNNNSMKSSDLQNKYEKQLEENKILHDFLIEEKIISNELRENLKEAVPEKNQCCICFGYTDKKQSCVPCGHTQYCCKCIIKIKNCSICSAKIDQIIKLY